MQFDNLMNESVLCWLSANKEDAVVFLIDMQVSQYSPTGDLTSTDWQRLMLNQKNVLRICRQLGIPVILTELIENNDPTYIELTDAELLGFFFQLNEEKRERVIKKKADAFDGTDLEGIVVEKFKAKKVLAMGISAEKCVKETVIHSLALGLQVCTGRHFIANYRYQPQDYMKWYEKQAGIELI